MSITARMRLSELLEQHPDAAEILENYGIELNDDNTNMTLEELCREESINYWELKSDIALSEGWDGASASDPFEESDEDAEDGEELDWDEEEGDEFGDDDLDEEDEEDDWEDEEGGDDDDLEEDEDADFSEDEEA